MHINNKAKGARNLQWSVETGGPAVNRMKTRRTNSNKRRGTGENCKVFKGVFLGLRMFLSGKFEQSWQEMGSNRNEGKVVAFIGKAAWGTGVVTYQSNGGGSARFEFSEINEPDWFAIKAVETFEYPSDTINAPYQSMGVKRIDLCKKWIAALKAIIKYTLTRSKLVPRNRGVNRRHLNKPCFIFQINKAWG